MMTQEASVTKTSHMGRKKRWPERTAIKFAAGTFERTCCTCFVVIDRRVVMISLFATTFLRSPRHRRRLAFGNRQVPSLEVGDVLHLLRCCHAVQQIAWTRTIPEARLGPGPSRSSG